MKELMICLGVLGLACVFLLKQGKRFAAPVKKEEAQPSSVDEILQMTKTNNTYPPLLSVLSGLQSNLEKKGITLHVDMRGYMSNEQT